MSTTPGFVPAISAEVPWETAHHLRLLYQAFGNMKVAVQNIKPGTTTENVTNINNETTGGDGGSMTPGIGGINNQTGNTTYATTVSDNGVLLILNDASPVAVSLNSGVSSPYILFATNLGAGLVTFTPTSGTINGGATLTLPFDFTTILVFDGANWFASGFPVVPQDTPATTGEYLTAYNATTGAFTKSTPAGISVTITTAAITLGGTTGSMTFVGGLLTAQVPAT